MNRGEIRDWILQLAELSFSRSGGPGGQHVNTSDTKVTLRLRISRLPLGEQQKRHVAQRLAGRINTQGELIIHASETRSQNKNREAAVERTVELIYASMQRPKKRRPTKPSKSSKERRLKEKRSRGEKKQQRKPPEY